MREEQEAERSRVKKVVADLRKKHERCAAAARRSCSAQQSSPAVCTCPALGDRGPHVAQLQLPGAEQAV